EADAKRVRDRRTEDEPARFHSHHDVDRLTPDLRKEPVDGALERVAVLEHRRDVLEQDARLREVRDIADAPAEVLRGDESHGETLAGASMRRGRAPDDHVMSTTCVSLTI